LANHSGANCPWQCANQIHVITNSRDFKASQRVKGIGVIA
jgi:hypothetical protein